MSFYIEFVSAIAAIIIFFISYSKWKANGYWARKNVPYIKTTGSSLTGFTTTVKESYDELKRKGYKHGGINSFMGPVYVPVDLELIKNILVKDFQHFSGHGLNANIKKDPLSGHLFNLEGEEWRSIRVKLSPTFTSGKMKMMFNTLLDCGVPMLEHIDNLCQNHQALDLKSVLPSYTTDVIGSCAFGIDCNSFKNPDSKFIKYGRSIFAPRPPPPKIFTLVPPLRKIARIFISSSSANKEMTDFYTNLIRDILEYRRNKQIKRNDFIQLFMEIQEKAKMNGEEGLTLQEIVAQCFSFFLAGYETSSSTMSFCLHELAFNQDIQDKLRNEIKETMKKHDGKLTYDGIMEMKYLDQVFNETLRKYPIVPVSMRVCTKDYKIPNTDITLEKGTRTFVSILGVHGDEKYYSNPKKFEPERFTEENKAKRPNFCYLPFGEGPRICLGMRFGLMQTKTGLSMLLNKYKFTPVKGDKYEIDFAREAFNLAKAGRMEVIPEII